MVDGFDIQDSEHEVVAVEVDRVVAERMDYMPKALGPEPERRWIEEI